MVKLDPTTVKPSSIKFQRDLFTDSQRPKMMIGEPTRRNPTVQIPQWDPYDDPMVTITAPFSVADIDGNANGGVPDYSHSPRLDMLTALHRYLPSNEFVDSDPLSDESDFPVDAFSCDHFHFDSPMRHRIDSYLKAGSFISSPTSILASPPVSPPSDSPPMSPNSPPLTVGSFNSVSDLVVSMRGLQLGKARMGLRGSGFVSPRGSMLRPGFCSLPSTPTMVVPRSGTNQLDQWDTACGEEPAMERVESGRGLRAKMFAKLSKENSLGPVENGQSTAPDVGWVSELVK
ncbi:zinc finger CCCH domain-containing protein 20 [Tripterygium wilfordii]|uniref:Zinc finger CCCH domain-containing protein 20 n=1 Tax=Tripterygium wilfordii TaxID=458696 RepID=A0A7J7DPP7_TRIWF|nr:zinc finger CCCH domain-containing protein 20 [Tripterygium wilfordii]